MAVDTAAKRASLVGYGLPFRLALPFADAAIGLGDRQHLVGLYSGIDAGSVAETPVVNICLAVNICTALEFTADICTALAFDAPICCGLDLTANVGGLC
jgi:hypothetical protein